MQSKEGGEEEKKLWNRHIYDCFSCSIEKLSLLTSKRGTSLSGFILECYSLVWHHIDFSLSPFPIVLSNLCSDLLLYSLQGELFSFFGAFAACFAASRTLDLGPMITGDLPVLSGGTVKESRGRP